MHQLRFEAYVIMQDVIESWPRSPLEKNMHLVL